MKRTLWNQVGKETKKGNRGNWILVLLVILEWVISKTRKTGIIEIEEDCTHHSPTITCRELSASKCDSLSPMFTI